jgi:putative DNA primase/helicase
LRVRIEGDVEAWRRRLMVIEFEKVVENPTPYFGRRLLEAEGPGILNWMLQGLRQLRANNGFSVTNDQRARVNELLEASDTVGEFISEMLHFDRPDADVTTEELVEAHARYCHRRGWTSRSDEVVTKRIHSVMRELHGVTTVRHDIVRGNTERRGYKGFALDTEPYESDTY